MKKHLTLMLKYLSNAKKERVGGMVTLRLWLNTEARKPSLVQSLSIRKKNNRNCSADPHG